MADDLKCRNNKALFEALNSDNLELAEMLLKRGADPNAVLAVEGVAPLHIAAGLGETAVKLLMAYGGDPNVRSADGTTPLHVAATWGDSDSLHLLLLNGGDPYIRDQEGVSVIESAANYNHDGCVALLEYFCLLLNPDEDTVSTAPKYTYQYKGSLGATPKISHEESDSMYLNDFHHQPFREKLKEEKFCQKELQKRVDGIFKRKENAYFDVTSPDHPFIKHKNVGSPQDPSLHVHWADKLTQTLVHIPRNDSYSSSSSDTFITCSGEENHPNKFFSPEMFNVSTNNSSKHDNRHEGCIVLSTGKAPTLSPSSSTQPLISNSQNTVTRSDLSGNMPTVSHLKLGSSGYTPSRNHKICNDTFTKSHTWEPSNIVLETDNSLISSDESFIKRHQTALTSKDSQKNSCRKDSEVFEDNNFNSVFSDSAKNSGITKHRVSFCQQDTKSQITDRPENIVNQHVDKTFLMDKLRQSLTSISSTRSSVSFGENDVLNSSFCCPRHSLDSTLSDTSTIDYIYTDREKGIQFIERHLPSLQGSSGKQSLDSSFSSVHTTDSQQTVIYDWKAFSDNSACSEDLYLKNTPDISIPDEIKRLDNYQLRCELLGKGDNPGPVTDQTRGQYLIRLAKIIADPGYLKLFKSPTAYSPELMDAFSQFDPKDLDGLEEQLIASFTNRNRCWREGTIKSSFNYLLLDPRVTKNLPNRMHQLGEAESFKVFVAAIFYVGKGKRSRPYCHLYEAIRQMEKPKTEVCDKVKHILEIWNDNLGVVSLHCFQNVIPVEAYTREACMVDAITLNKLTNKKKGDYYGISTTWSMKQKRRMGVYFLKKALQIFQGEGERQILPVDIKLGQ